MNLSDLIWHLRMALADEPGFMDNRLHFTISRENTKSLLAEWDSWPGRPESSAPRADLAGCLHRYTQTTDGTIRCDFCLREIPRKPAQVAAV